MSDHRHGERRTVMKHELDACRADVEARIAGHDDRLQTIEKNTKAILDIVSAWNNAQGFVKTIKAISTTIKVLAIPATAIGAIYYFITTGHVPKP